jgi:pimeloyl-ACP methyl ester carboxylesterase
VVSRTSRLPIVLVSVAAFIGGCGGGAGDDAGASTAPTDAPAWTESEIGFSFEGDELVGVVTVPEGDGPYPAVVLVSGSGGDDGTRAGVSAQVFVRHGRLLAEEGFAVLRYDPPGVGGSAGDAGLPSIERRVDETLAAVRYLASRTDVDPDRIGLQGWSQGPWVMALTAARHPDDVAFLVSVVGSGSSIAEQQIYGIEAQSRAAGLGEADVDRAVLFGRLLIDWQLPEPIYERENRTLAGELGSGPWADLLAIVYDSPDLDPRDGLGEGVRIMKTAQDEPWAAALYLRELYIPRFESIPADISADQLAALSAVSAENLMTDPEEFLTQVGQPVLAIFGELDLNVDSDRSAALYEEYLSRAGNDDVTTVVFPDVGHSVGLDTPGYWDTLSGWLVDRFLD